MNPFHREHVKAFRASPFAPAEPVTLITVLPPPAPEEPRKRWAKPVPDMPQAPRMQPKVVREVVRVPATVTEDRPKAP